LAAILQKNERLKKKTVGTLLAAAAVAATAACDTLFNRPKFTGRRNFRSRNFGRQYISIEQSGGHSVQENKPISSGKLVVKPICMKSHAQSYGNQLQLLN